MLSTRAYALAVGVAECDACCGTGRKPGSLVADFARCAPCEGTGLAGDWPREPTSDGDRVPMMRRKVPRHLEAPPKETT